MIQALLQSFAPSFHHFKPLEFTRRWLIVATLASFNLQCSWTPEVETILYEGPECVISLKTSHTLNKPPMHPTFLSESLLREVLTGIGIDQEKGVLQQLLLSTHSPVRAFSPSQVDFLAPYVSLAFSQATPEEMILFKCPPIDTQSFLVQGTLAVFSPTTLLLTLNDLKGHPTTRSSKMQHSSQKLQTRTSLTFSQQKTTIRVIDTQAFMSVPSSSHWIAIDFQPLESLNTNKTDIQLNQHDPHTISDKKIETPMAIDSLKAELQNLRKKVDQQAEEIRRLQGSSSP